MINKQGFETVIASPPAYNQLVAEVYYNGLFVALVSQERGPGVFDIETPSPEELEWAITHKVELDGFLTAIQEARDSRARLPASRYYERKWRSDSVCV